jgi:phage terminase large subunit-like protein
MPRELVIRWGPIPGTAQELYFDDDTPDGTILLTGGWGSGKTMTLMGKALKLSAINAPLMGIWAVPDYAHIHDTIIPTLADTDPETGDPWFLEPGQYHYHETRHVLTWDGGGPIQFVTAENPRSIAGPNAAWCATDEPGSVKREAWRNTIARVRHPSATLRQKIAAGTPEGLNYLADLFGPDRDPSHRVYRMATTDNTYLPPEYLAQIRANATEAELAAYLEGKFVNITGALAYPAFAAETQIKPILADAALPLRLAFDFNVDPMTCIVGQQWMGPYGPEFGVLQSISVMGSTVMDVCAEVVTRFPRWPAGVVVYGDASGKNRSHQSLRSNYDIIRELCSQIGPLSMKVPTANPPVALRLNSVNRLCRDARGVTRLWLAGDPQQPKLSQTRSLVKSLQQTVKKSGTDDVWKKPGETVTHAGEALGYWLTTEAPAQMPSAAFATITAHTAPTGSTAVQQLRAQKSARLAQEMAR